MGSTHITHTCTHTHTHTHTHVRTHVHIQQQSQVPTADLEPSIGTISTVMNLHGQHKALWKSRPVDICQWRQSMCIP